MTLLYTALAFSTLTYSTYIINSWAGI